MDNIIYDQTGGIATITLNRPDSLNSLTKGAMYDLMEAFARVNDDNSVRAVVLTGAGRGFCSGADLTQFRGSISGPSDDPGGMDEIFNPAIRTLNNLPVPTVARINGVAGGGGIGLALGCDITIAARSARFVCTFGPRLGIVPDIGTSWLLPRTIGRARAMAMAMLGDPLSADEAREFGLIWSVVEDEDLDATVAEMAARLAHSSPEAMRRIRASIDHATSSTLSQHLDLEKAHQDVLIPLNMHSAAQAFVDRAEPRFTNSRAHRTDHA